MAVMTSQQAEHQPTDWETPRMRAQREELAEWIARAIQDDGSVQPLPGLHLYRHSTPLERVYSVIEPSVCMVA